MREMKNSGIEWIGEIPNKWVKLNLKYLCNLKTGGTPNNKNGIENEKIGFPWITPQDIDASLHIGTFSQYITEKAIIVNDINIPTIKNTTHAVVR